MGAFSLEAQSILERDQDAWLALVRKAAWLENYRATLVANKLGKILASKSK